MTQGQDPEANSRFKGWFSDLKYYVLDLGTSALVKFSRTMKEMEWYLRATYRNSCRPTIVTNAPAAFAEPEMPTIVTDTGAERPKT